LPSYGAAGEDDGELLADLVVAGVVQDVFGVGVDADEAGDLSVAVPTASVRLPAWGVGADDRRPPQIPLAFAFSVLFPLTTVRTRDRPL
jgi:hypothetical protein